MIKVYCDICGTEIDSTFVNHIELRALDSAKLATGLGGSNPQSSVKHATCYECFKAIEAFIELRKNLDEGE